MHLRNAVQQCTTTPLGGLAVARSEVMRRRQAIRVCDVAGEPCYRIADAAEILGRSRPTLMRWASFLRRFTGHAPHQDGDGRWFFPVAAVERLEGDGALVKALGKASTTPDGELGRVARDVSHLKKVVSQLRADVDQLKKKARTA
jgi:hypothetical protein